MKKSIKNHIIELWCNSSLYDVRDEEAFNLMVTCLEGLCNAIYIIDADAGFNIREILNGAWESYSRNIESVKPIHPTNKTQTEYNKRNQILSDIRHEYRHVVLYQLANELAQYDLTEEEKHG